MDYRKVKIALFIMVVIAIIGGLILGIMYLYNYVVTADITEVRVELN